MSASAGPDLITDGLVLHLDAADTKSYPGSGTTWFDRSGNGFDGTLNGNPTFVNEYRGIIDFVQNGDNLYTGKTAAELGIPDDSFSFEVTLKKKENPPNSYSQGYGGFSNCNFKNTTNFFVSSRFNGGNSSLTNISLSVLEQWVTLTATYDGSVLKVYYNGEYKSQASITIDSIQSNTFAIAGYGYYQPHAYFACCRLYKKPLSDVEVKQNYQATKSRFQL